MHCPASSKAKPSIFLTVSAFLNEGGCAIWESRVLFLMARSLNYFRVETGSHKTHLHFFYAKKAVLFHIWLVSFWVYFCKFSFPCENFVPCFLINLSSLQASVDTGAKHIQLLRDLETLKGLFQGNWWGSEKRPAEFSFWVKKFKGTLNIYIPRFYETLGTIWKFLFIFGRKKKIRLTMKSGWHLGIRQKHELIFGARLNTCQAWFLNCAFLERGEWKWRQIT